MAQQHLKFAIFGNEYQAKKSASIEKILLYLEKKEAEVYVENAYYEFLTRDQHLDVKAAGVFEDYNFDVDYVISMGGDGTFLKAASRVGAKGTPIIGVNMGRLGFLADVLPSEIESALDSLYAGECLIEEHAVIQVEAEGGILAGNPFALNDIAVLKRDDASMISIRTQVDGEFLVTYQADGLIVTTPTGSTAYNLSNGGPIIIPQSGSICLTPVAPHSLNIRPIVINDTAVITLDIESRSHNYLVAIDGRSERMTEETRLIIRKAPHSIKIVKQRNQRYFSTLREKLMCASIRRSGITSVHPKLSVILRISASSSCETRSLAHTAVIPSPTCAGVLGIKRTTFRGRPAFSSSHARVLPGAMPIMVCSSVRLSWTSSRTSS